MLKIGYDNDEIVAIAGALEQVRQSKAAYMASIVRRRSKKAHQCTGEDQADQSCGVCIAVWFETQYEPVHDKVSKYCRRKTNLPI